MDLIKGEKIWDMSRISDRDKTRMELTDLIRFKGYWYCGFREGYIHNNHPSGRARIIRSADGENWDSVKLIEWDGADVREPKFSVSAEGNIMVNTSIAFVSKEPRPDGKPYAFNIYDRPQVTGNQYGAFFQLDKPGDPQNDLEENVTRQSVTWLSSDGEDWSSAYACHSGINTWRWEVAWHNGMGYSVGYAGKDKKGTLYRTRDGKNWRVLLNEFFPDGFGNEASLAFDSDNTAYCLLRDGIPRTAGTGNKDLIRNSDGHVIEPGQGCKVHGGNVPMLGIGKAPYYKEWEWKKLNVNWNGSLASADEVFRAPFGGPKIIRLKDGRFVAAGRVLGPGRDDGYITLFLVDTKKALLTMFAEIDGTTYGGIAENDGMLWVSYAAAIIPGFLGIFLVKVEIPDKK
jgi:hypothetical protein